MIKSFFNIYLTFQILNQVISIDHDISLVTETSKLGHRLTNGRKYSFAFVRY